MASNTTHTATDVKLETVYNFGQFKVISSTRRTVSHRASDRTNKTKSIVRNLAKLDNLEQQLMNKAFKAKRSEVQREARRQARQRG